MSETPPRCITLLTDYGWNAPFVGALHAVAYGIAPAATVIDLDHSVPPQDVRVGALRFERFFRYLPVGVHVGVVDPGVGTIRRPVAVRAGEQLFVAPDNGLLGWVLEAAGGAAAAVALENDAYLLTPRARTFDGRDMFVPAAAHLAAGVALEELGPPVDPAALICLERRRPERRADGAVVVEVAQLDGFGNVQFAADGALAPDFGLVDGAVVVVESADGRRVEARYGATFAAVAPGELVVFVDSDGQLALARNCGSANATLGVTPGTTLTLRVA